MPDSLTDPKKVIKSQIPAVNAPANIDVPEGQFQTANESKDHLKRDRPIGSKYNNPRKKSMNENGRIEEWNIKNLKKR